MTHTPKLSSVVRVASSALLLGAYALVGCGGGDPDPTPASPGASAGSGGVGTGGAQPTAGTPAG
ncbi:MAG TPA: hypothetical protein VER04_22340, partial [Polyangiaceae bacterium]|nr:hypothetical protein [Polyangiaceae bacterium]